MKGTSRGLAGFALSRALVLLLVLIVGSYSMIAIMNRDGALDEMHRSRIRDEVARVVYSEPSWMPPDEKEQLIDEVTPHEYRRQGLDRPFVIRNFSHLWWAISLNLGRNSPMVGLPVEVRTLLADRSGPTFLLFGTAILLILFISFLVARIASRRPGRLLDRLVLRLAPISALPAWFFGIFLILIFVSALRDKPLALPWGGMVPVPPPAARGEYVLGVLRHMLLPVASIVIATLFAATYSWRTFLVGHSSDEQTEPTGASESPGPEVDGRSFLRPTPPHFIKHFLVLAASVLMGSIILEVVFNWPGLGRLLYGAILLTDTAVILGALVIYGYGLAFLAVIVFLLDFLHVRHVLRRVRMGEE